MDDFDLAQFRDLFIDEGREYLQTLNTELLSLEHNPGDLDSLHAMFRAAHSLKGSAAMMGYESLAELAHAAEDVLHSLRDGRWVLTPVLTNLLFRAVDAAQSFLVAIAAGQEESADATSILQQLRGYTPEQETQPLPLPEQAPVETIPPPATIQVEHKGMIRVDVRHLDALLNIVTEMVIHRSLLERLGRRYKMDVLNEALTKHDRLLGQLRDAVLEMRMVPMSQVFDRFPRMVRDLLQAQGKEARLIVEGAEVEMDRMALEALNEPLVHLLRNAVHHGLELPAERTAAGKAAGGILRLSARRERDTVVIELSDDGRGIDVQAVAAGAVEQGFASAEAVAAMDEEETLGLVCLPGFSLSKEVTDVSGRGVGMNVVKRQVERLRGTLKISTAAGQGTTFRVRLPLKLALMPAVLFQLGSETYALPMSAVQQIIEFEPGQIEQVGDQDVLSFGEGFLPLRRLGALLEVPDADPAPRYALVVRRDDQPIGWRVDAVQGHEEIVVKPLPAALREIPGFGGVTILGEGQTVLILDENLEQVEKAVLRDLHRD